MILIFGEREYEQGTDQVMNWLNYYEGDFIKITLDDLLASGSDCVFDIDQNDVIYKGISLRNEINVIWYRRLLRNKILEEPQQAAAGNNLGQLQLELKRENLHLFEYLFSVLADKKWLPRSTHIHLNKLQVLHMAKRCGLSVPQSRVLNTRNDVLHFFKEANFDLITKSISDTSYYQKDKDQMFLAYTTAVTAEMAQHFPERFFPSLFQEQLHGVLELRIFYLEGKMMTQGALISEGISDKVDIKQRRKEQRIQYVVYQLPKDIVHKIRQLMEELALNIGSIDMIVTADDAHYFLEVNPGGQFFFESTNCNFHIEREIAQWLIKNDTHYEPSII